MTGTPEPASRHGAVSADATVTMVEGLRTAVEAGRGRLDDDELSAAAEVAERVRERLRLSAAHTIVALAGATGSGKSSLFNALSGLDLAAIGVRRPTTSWATACAWDPTGAADLLSWLGVPARHQVSRLSMLDVSPEDHELEGLVLLDLPDHDSTEVSHHLEVDRLVRYADMIVWVLDPQKYADAALHERYLQPYASHSEVMFAVLNQVDRLDSAEVDVALGDVRRLLADDGLADIPVLATSTVRGDGLPELRQVLVERLRAKEAVRVRVAADVAVTAHRLVEHAGAEPAAGADPQVHETAKQALVDEASRSAGLDERSAHVADEAAGRARRAAGWPPGAQLFRDGRGAGTQGAVAVDDSLVDGALQDYVARLAGDMSEPWVRSLRSAAVSGRTKLVERLGELSRSVAASTQPPLWARLFGVLQVLLVLGALGAVGWQLADDPADIQGYPGGYVIAGVAAALALLLSLVGGGLAARSAQARVGRHSATTRAEVVTAVDDTVATPVATELAAYDQWCRGLDAARLVS